MPHYTWMDGILLLRGYDYICFSVYRQPVTNPQRRERGNVYPRNSIFWLAEPSSDVQRR